MARQAAAGEPFAYTGHGAASAVVPLLDRELVAELTVAFQESPGGYTIALGGSLVLADQVFSYDFAVGSLVLTAQSQTYGSATFVSTMVGPQQR